MAIGAFPSANHIAPGGVVSYEPQRSFMFELTMGAMKEEFTLSVQSWSNVSVNNETITLGYGTESRKVAGKASFDAGSLTIRDFVDKDTAGIIEDWRAKVYSTSGSDGKYKDGVEGTLHAAAHYKVTGTLFEHPPANSNSEIRMWKIVGAWPQSVNHGSLDNDTSDIVRIEVTIEFDKAYRIK